MTVHYLKCWPPFFDDVNSGSKTFELRKNDRRYAVGDSLVLREFAPTKQQYTGRECRRLVSYVMSEQGFGLREGYVALGLAVPPP